MHVLQCSTQKQQLLAASAAALRNTINKYIIKLCPLQLSLFTGRILAGITDLHKETAGMEFATIRQSVTRLTVSQH